MVGILSQRKFKKSTCALFRSATRCAITARRNCFCCPYFQEPIEGLEIRDYLSLYEQRRLARRSFSFSIAALLVSVFTLIVTALRMLLDLKGQGK